MNLTHLPVTLVVVALVVLMIDGRSEAEESASVNNAAAKNSLEDQQLPDLPLAITSFGADRAGDAIYVYGGHHGQSHHYSTAGQSGDLLRLDLANPTMVGLFLSRQSVPWLEVEHRFFAVPPVESP